VAPLGLGLAQTDISQARTQAELIGHMMGFLNQPELRLLLVKVIE
jgi:hypothetical protein